MELLFLECAVRAALLAGTMAIVLYAMRVKEATARHCVWTGVVALMLILPIWTAWGPRAPLRVLPPLAQSIANKAKAPIEIFSTGVLPSTLVSPGLAVLLGAYLLGLCLLLFRLAIGTVQTRRLVRDAVLHDGVRTSSLCAAPVTVGLLHPTVIFPEHWRQWPQAQLDAVLTHESEHAQRRHPLVQWLALLNRALFWFHPVAWWLERQTVRSQAEYRWHGYARKFLAAAYPADTQRRPSTAYFTHADGMCWRRLCDYLHRICRWHFGSRPAGLFHGARHHNH